MKNDLEILRCSRMKPDEVKIMARASVYLQGEVSNAVEIQRGMTLVSLEGTEVGKIAGLAVSRDRHEVLCLILGHLPEEGGYQSLPVTWVECVEREVIILNVQFEMVQALPDWHST